MKRIDSLDILKGTIIVLMSLDHFRDYFHQEAFFFSPTDPEKTNSVTFFLRWITHYCAPVFAFLAGISADIIGKKYDKGICLNSYFQEAYGWYLLKLPF